MINTSKQRQTNATKSANPKRRRNNSESSSYDHERRRSSNHSSRVNNYDAGNTRLETGSKDSSCALTTNITCQQKTQCSSTTPRQLTTTESLKAAPNSPLLLIKSTSEGRQRSYSASSIHSVDGIQGTVSTKTVKGKQQSLDNSYEENHQHHHRKITETTTLTSTPTKKHQHFLHHSQKNMKGVLGGRFKGVTPPQFPIVKTVNDSGYGGDESGLLDASQYENDKLITGAIGENQNGQVLGINSTSHYIRDDPDVSSGEYEEDLEWDLLHHQGNQSLGGGKFRDVGGR